MLGLLAILASGLVVGRFARRMTPAIELLLLGLVAGIVLLEFASWSRAGGETFRELVDWIGSELN
jgi:hypothetical protein